MAERYSREPWPGSLYGGAATSAGAVAIPAQRAQASMLVLSKDAYDLGKQGVERVIGVVWRAEQSVVSRMILALLAATSHPDRLLPLCRTGAITHRGGLHPVPPPRDRAKLGS